MAKQRPEISAHALTKVGYWPAGPGSVFQVILQVNLPDIFSSSFSLVAFDSPNGRGEN
jgi:hypothetical protein